MRISETAAQTAIHNGAFLMAGDASWSLTPGDVITVSERFGLEVLDVLVIPVIDAPLDLVSVMYRQVPDGFSPHYGDLFCETAQQAALAQMLHDAGEGFDLDDLLVIDALDAQVSVISIKQVGGHGN